MQTTAAKPNVVVLFVDQLRAASLPLYGETQIETPNLDRLASEGVTLDNAISNCPVCTPARAMLVTGRHPQTTGHLINTTKTRHSELSIADAFAHRGYRTGWVGKWHLHTGVWPAIDRMPQHPDWIPEGRDRLGFEYWRAYNQHMVYFNGFVHGDDWNYERWDGYETDGLLKYGIEFMDSVQASGGARDARETASGGARDAQETASGGARDAGEKQQAGNPDPFLLFLSPHQPHYTPFEFAPEHYYDRLPAELTLPENVPVDGKWYTASIEMYRDYLAMILAVDDMVGNLMDYLERTGLADNTILVFASDHGTQAGAHDTSPWQKKHPHEESIRIPTIFRYPGVLPAGKRTDGLFAMTDYIATLCGLCDIPVPRSVEGKDLSDMLRAPEQGSGRDDALIMNFSRKFDWFSDGMEWRGVRTKTHSYAKWLSGKEELYSLVDDPLQMNNLVGSSHQGIYDEMVQRLERQQVERGDELVPCTDWKHWLDHQRRIIRNGFGPLGDPEGEPDWSLLH